MTDLRPEPAGPPPVEVVWEVTPQAIAGILTSAVVLLEQDGWCQKRAHERRGDRCAHCIGGAVTLAAAEHARTLMRAHGLTAGTAAGRAVHRDVWEHAVARLRAYLGTGDIGEWNDRPGRTFAEVINTLRAAAR